MKLSAAGRTTGFSALKHFKCEASWLNHWIVSVKNRSANGLFICMKLLQSQRKFQDVTVSQSEGLPDKRTSDLYQEDSGLLNVSLVPVPRSPRCTWCWGCVVVLRRGRRSLTPPPRRTSTRGRRSSWLCSSTTRYNWFCSCIHQCVASKIWMQSWAQRLSELSAGRRERKNPPAEARVSRWWVRRWRLHGKPLWPPLLRQVLPHLLLQQAWGQVDGGSLRGVNKDVWHNSDCPFILLSEPTSVSYKLCEDAAGGFYQLYQEQGF